MIYSRKSAVKIHKDDARTGEQVLRRVWIGWDCLFLSYKEAGE